MKSAADHDLPEDRRALCSEETGRVVREELLAREISNVMENAPMYRKMRIAARSEAKERHGLLPSKTFNEDITTF